LLRANPRQRQAVTHAGSPLLIVAGAGSGKTRVLTHRIAWLLAERQVHPGEIMSITFTNKAAAEMKARVDALVGRRAAAMWVSTFHSMCVRILRREAKHLGCAPSPSTTPTTRAARRPRRPRSGSRPEEVQRPAGRRADLQPQNSSSLRTTPPAPPGVRAQDRRDLRRLPARLRTANAFDFDDLIMETWRPAAAARRRRYYRRRFRHVLVDSTRTPTTPSTSWSASWWRPPRRWRR
jgi:DNA helicase-2/ATP-dependent DNA helicase PcrA